MKLPDEVHGLSQIIGEMRKHRHFGKLEAAILTGIIVMLVSAFLSIWYVIGQQIKQAERDRQAAIDRERTEQIAVDVRATLDRLVAAINAGPASQEAAIRRLLEGMQRLLERQTQVIVREGRRETIVVYVTPSPQPTATYTCNPVPVLTRKPCR